MVLCDRCVAIDFGLLIERACSEARPEPLSDALSQFKITEDVPFADIKNAAHQGCELCGMIQYGLLDMPYLHVPDNDVRPGPDTAITLLLVLQKCHPDFTTTYAQCYGLRASHRLAPPHVNGGVTLTLASSNGNNPRVSKLRSSWNPALWRSWIDDCVGTHEQCKPTDLTQYTPTRLIDVGSGTAAPRLVESQEGSPEYVALSHCWGGSLPLRTTSANFQDLLETLPLELMPVSFQDAVQVTRAMGYRFLWIDCLCIIQDSESDWLRECALMHQVYAYAVVTISASQSTSPSDGMFEPVDRPGYTYNLPTCWTSTGELDSLMIDLPPHPLRYGPDSIMIGPLSKRGWVLQEQVLSRRLLHICASGTFFQCAYCERSDRLPWPMVPSRFSESLTCTRNFLREALDPCQLLGQWYGLVFNYAGRYLTYAGDRLPAMSGIARLVAGRLDESYLAGLWSSDIVAGLVWTVRHADIPRATHPSHYPGPLWSWTSVNRAICYPAVYTSKRHSKTWFRGRESIPLLEVFDWAPCLEVQDWSIELAGNDPFAEVKSGRLTLTGKMRSITITDPTGRSQQPSLSYVSDQSIKVEYCADSPEPATDSQERKIAFGLLVGFEGGGAENAKCVMLVVQPIAGHADTLKRIGCMSVYLNSGYGESAETFYPAVDWILAAETRQIYLV
jgi:hypothetical protein